MSFENILGHKASITILKNAITNNKIAHGYLFVGPKGIGKSLVAKTFAKTLNCQANSLDCCDTCASCIKIDTLNHPDVHWVLPEGNSSVKIDQIRKIQGLIYLKPYESTKKIFVIDEVDKFTDESANSLLKTLEEPPKDTVIILIASNINRVFGTVISRCQKILFFPLSIKEVETALLGLGIDVKKAYLLSHLSEGSIGKALSLNEGGFLEEVDKLIDFVLNKEKKFIRDLAFSGEAIIKRENLKEIIIFTIGILRDLLVLKSGYNTTVINRYRYDELVKKLDNYSYQDLLAKIEELYKLYPLIEQNINPKIITELLPSLGY